MTTWVTPPTLNDGDVLGNTEIDKITTDLNACGAAKVTAKGSLTPATAANLLGELTVGANGRILLPNSGETTGLKYNQWQQHFAIMGYRELSNPAAFTSITGALIHLNYALPTGFTAYLQVVAMVSGTATFDTFHVELIRTDTSAQLALISTINTGSHAIYSTAFTPVAAQDMQLRYKNYTGGGHSLHLGFARIVATSG